MSVKLNGQKGIPRNINGRDLHVLMYFSPKNNNTMLIMIVRIDIIRNGSNPF